jgi:hypothetical protein
VTRLGEFSLIGHKFSLIGQFFYSRSSPIFGGNFFTVKAIWEKMGWTTFWAMFLQTHLVTLL